MSIPPLQQSDAQPATRSRTILFRLARLLGCLTAGIVFLLFPPAWTPYGVLAWLGRISWAAWRQTPIGRWIWVLAAMVLAKQIDMPWTAWLLLGSLAALALAPRWARGLKQRVFWTGSTLAIAWAASLHLLFEYEHNRVTLNPDRNRQQRSIVCVGDSLTAYGFPKLLAQRTDLPVVDLSEDGITTVQGIRKLEQIVEARPKVVVIELGGHDYLKGWPRKETESRLSEMTGRTAPPE